MDVEHWAGHSVSRIAAAIGEPARARIASEIATKKTTSIAILGDPSHEGLIALDANDRRRQSLPLDVVFPVLHGTYGEDGTLQGLLEMANVPYVGCGVLASSCGMDKVTMKALFREAGLPICKHTWLLRSEFELEPEKVFAAGAAR